MAILFFIGAFLYLATLRGVPGSPTVNDVIDKYDRMATPFESSHERGPYILVLSLIHNHSFGFDIQSAKAAHPDVGYHNNKFYIYFAPGVSLLTIPLFLLGQHFNLGLVFGYATISLVSTCTLLFLFAISRNIFKLSLWVSLFVPLVYGFASTAWAYSGTIYQHQVTSFLIISGFYAVWKFKQASRWSVLWALYVWVAYSAAIFVDYPNALLMLPVIIYFIFSSFQIKQIRNMTLLKFRNTLLITSIVFFVLSGLHAFYNYKNFGSPTRLSGSLPSYNKYILQQQLAQKHLKVTPVNTSSKENVANFFSDEQLPNGVYELLFAIDKGLFIFSPIFILAVFGIITACMQISTEVSILLSIIIIDICLYGSFSDPWGGWAFGPRYIIPAMSVLSVFVGIWLGKVSKQLYAKIIAYVLFAISGAIALLGSITTNLIPPIVEAIPLHISYTYLSNIHLLQKGVTSNFIFNQYLINHMSLVTYYILIYEVLLIVSYIVVFILPFIKKYEN